MLLPQQISDIAKHLEGVFSAFITRVPAFEVINKKYLPEGLKPHTRSICWLAEQVILQNVKANAAEHHLSAFEYPDSDISAWDARFRIDDVSRGNLVYVNIKVTDVTKPRRKNDIASVQKLLNFYDKSPDALLYYVVLKIQFKDNEIKFHQEPIVRYYPWLGDFVVNVRNKHVQCFYDVHVVQRSVKDFTNLIRQRLAR